MKRLLSGNEAIARGAYEAGVRLAAAYPGTPSTEILEALAEYPDVHSQWSPNEKVALEVALGAAFAGARALVAMKHVGLNVAADPLFTASYTGIKGGLVVVTADDPGMHSSQNEQDNRHYARAAKVPMFEPADSQEAKDFTLRAFEISEQFDTPVLVRTTTRVSHSKSVVTLNKARAPRKASFERATDKYVMIPAHARRRHEVVEERMTRLRSLSDNCAENRIEWGDRALGIIASGVAYQYARDVCPKASFLKLGMTYPLPDRLIREFARGVERLVVVEELDPYIEEHVKSLGLTVEGKSLLSITGELGPDSVATALGGNCQAASEPVADLPVRPPVMCPGCPHRGLFYVLKKLKLTVTGDIGCYTLSVLPPLTTMDSCVCMGASIGNAVGLERALGTHEGVVAVIGDSTFVHSGITGLVEIAYNASATTVIILDNGTTAMTGGQDHPATGRTLRGQTTHRLDLEALARAIGIEDTQVVDPYDLEATEAAVRRAIASPAPSVIIARRACVLLDRSARGQPLAVDPELCRRCGVCFLTGCPAIEGTVDPQDERGRRQPRINPLLCTGCGVCSQVCQFGAIKASDA